MKPLELSTTARNTWCPGCGNFSILSAIRAVLARMDGEGYPIENTVLVSGIGCHGKMVDYLDVNSFYSIQPDHSRCHRHKTGQPGSECDLLFW